MVLNRCPKCGEIMTPYLKHYSGRPVIFEKCEKCGYNTEDGDKDVELGGKSPWIE